MRSYVFFTLLFFSSHLYSQQIFILIHGTWGLETDWYMPGGDFFDALELSLQKTDSVVVPFSWSGKNSYEARETAARNLAKLVDSYDKKTDIILVGHSHGGTVALLASYKFQKNRIFCLFTLGTPINKSLYPNMNVIEYCYNLFSFEDLIQSLFGLFEREYASHERVANIRVIINEKEPDHTSLHGVLVGRLLSHVHACVQNAQEKPGESGMLFFSDAYGLRYAVDTERDALLERDHQLSAMMLMHSLSLRYSEYSRISSF